METLNAQNFGNFEVLIEKRNVIPGPVYVRVSPVGTVFNGNGDLTQYSFQGKYSLEAAHTSSSYPGINKIYGGISPDMAIGGNEKIWINHDYGGLSFDPYRLNVMLIGWGKYKIEFGYYDDLNYWVPFEGDSYCYYDISDGIYGPTRTDSISMHFASDIAFYLNYSATRKYFITFNFSSAGQEIDITDSRIQNRTVKWWHQIGRNHPILGNDPYYPGSPHKGFFNSDNFSSNNEFPIVAPVSINNRSFIHDSPGEFKNAILNVVYNSYLKNQNNLSFYNTDLIVKNNISFEIQENSNLNFTNSTSSFQTLQGSIINFPQNYLFSISNGASLNSKGTTFTSSSSWNGIKLENSGVDSIINCTFNNASTSLSIINNPGSYASRIIKNNTFNIPAGGLQGINGENIYDLLIQDNVFNMSGTTQTGIYLKNSTANAQSLTGGGMMEDPENSLPYSLNIINNNFNNGYVSVIIANYLTNLLPYNIKGNTFNSPNYLGLLGMKIAGNIKDNNFINNSANKGIHLTNSFPNLYNNLIGSENVSLSLVSGSYVNLAPYSFNGQLVWTGGKNQLESNQLDNIQLAAAGNAITDFGENTFTVSGSSDNHIYGWLDSTITKYYGRNNCWYPTGNSQIYLKRAYTNSIVPTETGNTSFSCITAVEASDWEVNYLGNGIYDSIKKSSDNTGEIQSSEDILYSQGLQFMESYMFNDAITTYKDLIDNFHNFYNLPKSVYILYECYQNLDTSSSQNYRNTLYGNLKNYIESKLDSVGYHNEEFQYNAFDVYLMCETNIQNYSNALNGYEFTALFHPDPDVRLMASWNYAEIEALLNTGNGGGEKQLQVSSDELQVKEFQELKEFQRLEEVISNDPILSKMKRTFERASVDRKERIDRMEKQSGEDSKINNITETIKEKSNEIDRIKENKARRNIFELKNLSSVDLERRRIEDLMLSTIDVKSKVESKENNNLSKGLKLYQNYPNPFNPSTNITFEIPSGSQVTLKVFDITGKEITTLVNEFKQKGSYNVTFNGINLSSGIYYFKISAGEWNQVKKMMLIK